MIELLPHHIMNRSSVLMPDRHFDCCNLSIKKVLARPVSRRSQGQCYQPTNTEHSITRLAICSWSHRNPRNESARRLAKSPYIISTGTLSNFILKTRFKGNQKEKMQNMPRQPLFPRTMGESIDILALIPTRYACFFSPKSQPHEISYRTGKT